MRIKSVHVEEEREREVKPLKDEPVLTSATMFKVPGDDFAWKAIALKTKGDKVISQNEICTPNIRAIVEEHFKIFVARNILRRT